MATTKSFSKSRDPHSSRNSWMRSAIVKAKTRRQSGFSSTAQESTTMIPQIHSICRTAIPWKSTRNRLEVDVNSGHEYRTKLVQRRYEKRISKRRQDVSEHGDRAGTHKY